MKELPFEINQKISEVLREKITISEFENWIYSTSEKLQSIFSEDEYFELISFNYQKASSYEIRKLLSKYIDLSEIETGRILSLLYKIKNKDENLKHTIQLLYNEYQKNDYHFLNEYIIFRFSYYSNYEVSHYWKNLSEYEKKNIYEYYKIILDKTTDFYIDCLQNGKIKIISRFSIDILDNDNDLYQPDEQNNIDYAYIDNRTEKEKNGISSFPIDEFLAYLKK